MYIHRSTVCPIAEAFVDTESMGLSNALTITVFLMRRVRTHSYFSF